MRFVSIGRWVLCLDYITHVQAFHGVDEELIAAEVHMTGRRTESD